MLVSVPRFLSQIVRRLDMKHKTLTAHHPAHEHYDQLRSVTCRRAHSYRTSSRQRWSEVEGASCFRCCRSGCCDAGGVVESRLGRKTIFYGSQSHRLVAQRAPWETYVANSSQPFGTSAHGTRCIVTCRGNLPRPIEEQYGPRESRGAKVGR